MCGFVGEINFETPQQNKIFNTNLKLKDRGPDSQKIGYVDKNLQFNISENFSVDSKINIGFSRLSILELSKLADQPFISQDKKFALLFNGEIYNFKEIQKDLKSQGVNFISEKSDTEVVLHSLILWGDEAVHKFKGQFSIAFIDLIKNEITLIRDRLGQKPLFFYMDKKKLFFGSTLNSVLSLLHEKDIRLNAESMAEYLNLGVVTSPNTIIENIYKLEPGTLIKFTFNNIINIFYKKRYWNPINFVDKKEFDSDVFSSLLKKSVLRRTVSDVPFATLLSGGLDSTTIVQQLSENHNNINTFSINVLNSDLDESSWSSQVAKVFSTQHVTENISSKNDLTDIFNIINSLDEPFADPSYIPSFLISQKISNDFKVALSGDGGDELLMGYARHYNILKTSEKFKILKKIVSKLYYFYPNFFGTGKKIMNIGGNSKDKLRHYFEDIKFLSLLGLKTNRSFLDKFSFETYSDIKNLQIMEYQFYLSEMMMYKIDRSSMANSLEIRSPFVDHEIVEYILSCDENFYFDLMSQKNLFRKYLSKNFNYEFINRPKQGFSFPLFEFIYKVNKNKIKKILLGSSLFNNIAVRLLFVIQNKANAKRIWKMLILVKWIEKNVTK
tara:strand:- start:9490 stop:11328 length:1839 start_codon:yes stop_codon:yes gene_type:complete